MQQMINALLKLIGLYREQIDALPKVDNSVSLNPIKVYNEVKESMKSPYLWDTQMNARHSVRVVCDEEKLIVDDKNDLCATIGGESGWKSIRSKKKNFDGTYDWGIVQINEKYWIGEGKLYPNTEYVLNNPEICVRWMIKQWKSGNKDWWYAWKNKSYKKYLNPQFNDKGELL